MYYLDIGTSFDLCFFTIIENNMIRIPNYPEDKLDIMIEYVTFSYTTKKIYEFDVVDEFSLSDISYQLVDHLILNNTIKVGDNFKLYIPFKTENEMIKFKLKYME